VTTLRGVHQLQRQSTIIGTLPRLSVHVMVVLPLVGAAHEGGGGGGSGGEPQAFSCPAASINFIPDYTSVPASRTALLEWPQLLLAATALRIASLPLPGGAFQRTSDERQHIQQYASIFTISKEGAGLVLAALPVEQPEGLDIHQTRCASHS
jgi:hypothetical protein